MKETVFKLIKLLDNLQQYSKAEVISEYQSCDDEIPEIILNKSIYPNGNQLGFYNYSENDLDKLSKLKEEDIKDEFLDYLDSFSENVYDYLESLDIGRIIESISNKELLSLIFDLTHENSDDFLSKVIAGITVKDEDNSLSFANSFGDEFLSLLVSCKLSSKYDVSYTSKYDNVLTFNNSKDENDIEIANFAFNNNKDELKRVLSEFNSEKLIITLSSSCLDENISLLNCLKNPNNLDSIISLPIYDKTENLNLLVINSLKESTDFLFIDESESLLHKNNSLNYDFAENELIPNIVESYLNRTEYENSLILPVSSLIKTQESSSDLTRFNIEEDDKFSKKRVYKNDLADQLIQLKENESTIKDKMSRNKVTDSDAGDILTFTSSASTLDNLMYAKKRPDPENLLYKHEKRLIDEDVKFVNLSEIADLTAIAEKNDKNTILIATCKQCDSKLVFYNHDIEDFKDQVFIEIDNISKEVLKEYIYVYLNSYNGLDEIMYFSKRNYMIKTEQMGYVKIPLVSLKTQLEIIDAVHESEEFFKTIDRLKKDFQSNILDYKHVIESINELKGEIEFGENSNIKLKESMAHAYNGLIWPLAASYLYATKGGFESVEKKDNYLVLFEFITAFNFIILLSGLPNNVYKKYKWDIWNAKNKNMYKDMTFGKWMVVTENIAEVYRNNNFSSKLDDDLFNKISSRKLLKILNKTKDYRNIESHSSHSNKYEADKVLAELNVYLDDIFDILEVYSNYRLIYVVSRDNLSHRVITLNGPCAPPLYDTITFDEHLEKNRLYLYNPRNNKKLLIKDNFMKFKELDDDRKHWALFIYDSCDKHEFYASYKCYQSNEKPLKCHIYDFKKDIIG